MKKLFFLIPIFLVAIVSCSKVILSDPDGCNSNTCLTVEGIVRDDQGKILSNFPIDLNMECRSRPFFGDCSFKLAKTTTDKNGRYRFKVDVKEYVERYYFSLAFNKDDYAYFKQHPFEKIEIANQADIRFEYDTILKRPNYFTPKIIDLDLKRKGKLKLECNIPPANETDAKYIYTNIRLSDNNEFSYYNTSFDNKDKLDTTLILGAFVDKFQYLTVEKVVYKENSAEKTTLKLDSFTLKHKEVKNYQLKL